MSPSPGPPLRPSSQAEDFSASRFPRSSPPPSCHGNLLQQDCLQSRPSSFSFNQVQKRRSLNGSQLVFVLFFFHEFFSPSIDSYSLRVDDLKTGCVCVFSDREISKTLWVNERHLGCGYNRYIGIFRFFFQSRVPDGLRVVSIPQVFSFWLRGIFETKIFSSEMHRLPTLRLAQISHAGGRETRQSHVTSEIIPFILAERWGADRFVRLFDLQSWLFDHCLIGPVDAVRGFFLFLSPFFWFLPTGHENGYIVSYPKIPF